jgi:hypothetical protein
MAYPTRRAVAARKVIFIAIQAKNCRKKRMAKPLRSDYPGAVYQDMAHADGGKPMFIEKGGRDSHPHYHAIA